MKRFISLTTLAMTLVITGCSEEKREVKEIIRPVKVFHIAGAEDILERTIPGKVEASEKADISFLIDGQIVKLPVKEGDQVKKGQLLAQLDPTDYQIAYDEAKSKEEYAKVQLERMSKLAEQEFISRSRYDQQKTAYDIAKANLDTAQQNLEYTTLLAPFDGEVATRYVENFQNVKAKEPIVHLHNRKFIDVSVQVPESLAIHAGKGKKVEIEVEFDSAPGKKYPAKVKEISSQADPDTQTYKLTLIMKAPKNLNIFPGMTTTVYAKIPLNGDAEKGTFEIPLSAVVADENKNSFVWVIDPKTNAARKQLVQLGQLENDRVTVTKGLSPGLDIVSAGAKYLQQGMKVRPLHEGEHKP